MDTKILGAYAFFVSLVAAISLTVFVTLTGSADTDKNAFEHDIQNLGMKLAAAKGEAERLRQMGLPRFGKEGLAAFASQ